MERYPLASLPVTHDGPLPPVDNLFLDMNGISEWGGVGPSPSLWEVAGVAVVCLRERR